MEKTKPAKEVAGAEALTKIKDHLQVVTENMQDNRTAKLWLQNMEMVDILRRVLRAECSGNWELHLQSFSEMLAYLAAS